MTRRAPLALGLALPALALAACFYEVAELHPDAGDTSSASGAGSAGGSIPACTAASCPDAAVCDTANGWCVVPTMTSCGQAVVVDEPARFHGDTCAGYPTSECNVSIAALVFRTGEGSWRVVPEGDGQASDLAADCSHGTMGCNTTAQLGAGVRFAVWREPCGEVTVGVTHP